MSSFLRETIDGSSFELLIDADIFSKEIILKAAYNHLDKGYFFFKFDEERNILLEFTPKEWVDKEAKIIIWEFSDELLDVYLRDKLEKDNKIIREAIVTKALTEPLDMWNFVQYDSDNRELPSSEQNEIDFDKDIDDILKEIENDPDLQIDEWEIDQILKEIEEEAAVEIPKPEVKLNPDSISAIKKSFGNKK